ncbi:DNA sulfur modification protein DndB [Shewanella algae]|jgi:DNA sulfur modification protein DndB|uniref:DNA sulfur modification protein DndB n=1 Tax=Shewanella algae TaxID=38313 RepID=UPI00118283EE|nr:DNA sulfur modification protein DndB [Shewanella algae]MBO2558923.1 DNA sulfur modification protein DndB [Shewanella algae]MBO2575924.1 DNA sulfur modification protein DndB [Shewanella algae]TVO81279.1 hypothetical protein AYI80_21325 [Shewanella algae]TXS81975.1 hypothetical protein AYI81_21290 [Shewanella algae]
MYYRVAVEGFSDSVETCRDRFGLVLGRHNDSYTAFKASLKGSTSSNALKRIDQVVIEYNDDNLKVNENHREIFWPLYRDSRADAQAARCADVIEAIKTGEKSDEACANLHFFDEFGAEMFFDDWFAKFEKGALELLEERDFNRQKMAEMKAKQASVVQSFEQAASEYTYSFPAVKGIQANKEFYIAQVPFKYLVKFFTFADETLPAELRAQRVVNPAHARDIADYVVSNRDSYVLPGLTVSVNASMVFDPLNVGGLADRLGVLRIPVDATLLINDGQHRRMSAETFIQLDKTLRDETIPVVFYFDEGLARSKQMFADLNANLSKPNAAINALYNLRNPFNRFVLDALERHPEINALVDKERTTIGAKSVKLWSLVHWKKFAEKLLGVSEAGFANLPENETEAMATFFDTVVDNMQPTFRLLDRTITGVISPETLRTDFIIGHAVFLESLGLALSVLADKAPQVTLDAMKPLSSLAFNKDNALWAGRCVKADRMVKNNDSVKLTAAQLRQTIGLELSNSMIETCLRHGFNY